MRSILKNGTKLAYKNPKAHKVTIPSSLTFTFSDVDFMIYVQKAFYSKRPYKIRIEDWEPGYCEAYCKTLRTIPRWKPLIIRYEERGHYIYVCRRTLEP